jgi:hypothetical protein
MGAFRMLNSADGFEAANKSRAHSLWRAPVVRARLVRCTRHESVANAGEIVHID